MINLQNIYQHAGTRQTPLSVEKDNQITEGATTFPQTYLITIEFGV